ncbi:MAG: hypothetical protein K2H29_01385 [Oscillospiraceae bacterium]|nr:hypothetical protein [Oscillospiraceae bacterium]
MLDMKAKMEELMQKIKNDKDFSKKFTENPVKAVEDLLGVDLPDDQINAIINGVKAKLTAENIADAAGKLSGLFGKKS